MNETMYMWGMSEFVVILFIKRRKKKGCVIKRMKITDGLSEATGGIHLKVSQ